MSNLEPKGQDSSQTEIASSERAGLAEKARPPSSLGSTRSSGRRRATGEWLAVVAIALVAAFVLRTWIVQVYFIPSTSMVPTLKVGDRIIVDKLSYQLHPVHPGNIVVFRRPPGDSVAPGIKDLVKRVVGLPGQTISSGPNDTVLIDGRPLRQPWLAPNTVPGPPIRSQVIPPHHYFVMGDNRSNSEDSRYFGTISGKLIVGEVVARIWPLQRFTIFG